MVTITTFWPCSANAAPDTKNKISHTSRSGPDDGPQGPACFPLNDGGGLRLWLVIYCERGLDTRHRLSHVHCAWYQLHTSLPIFPELDSAHHVRRLLLLLLSSLTLCSPAPCSIRSTVMKDRDNKLMVA